MAITITTFVLYSLKFTEKLPNFYMLFHFLNLLAICPKVNYFCVYRMLITRPAIAKTLLENSQSYISY